MSSSITCDLRQSGFSQKPAFMSLYFNYLLFKLKTLANLHQTFHRFHHQRWLSSMRPYWLPAWLADCVWVTMAVWFRPHDAIVRTAHLRMPSSVSPHSSTWLEPVKTRNIYTLSRSRYHSSRGSISHIKGVDEMIERVVTKKSLSIWSSAAAKCRISTYSKAFAWGRRFTVFGIVHQLIRYMTRQSNVYLRGVKKTFNK